MSTADLIARSGPIEVPVGIVTYLGAPFLFLFFIKDHQKNWIINGINN